MRLDVPLDPVKIRRTERFQEATCDESSVRTKNPKDKDVQVLKDHVHRQDFSFGDAFLQSPGSKRPAESLDLDIVGSAKKRRDAIELERELPKMFTAMEKALVTTKSDVNKALGSGELVWAVIRNVDEQYLNPAFSKYVMNLMYKMLCLYRFRGDAWEQYSRKMLGDIKIEAAAPPAGQASRMEAPAPEVVVVAEEMPIGVAFAAVRLQHEQAFVDNENKTK